LGVKMSIRFSSSHLILFVFETNILFVCFVFLKKSGTFLEE